MSNELSMQFSLLASSLARLPRGGDNARHMYDETRKWSAPMRTVFRLKWKSETAHQTQTNDENKSTSWSGINKKQK